MYEKLALMGRMRSGKDYVAQHLRLFYGHERFAFADKLKEGARCVFPEQFADGQKPRKLLQDFGQKMREIDPEVWIKALMHELDRKDPQLAVITDLRQPNEFDALKAAGFVIIKVQVSRETQMRRLLAGGVEGIPEELDHETESYIDVMKPDFVLHNDEDSDAILEQVDNLMATLGGIRR